MNSADQKRLRQYVNEQVKLVDVVREHYGVELSPGSCRCVFHSDSRSSAKLHEDNSLYCFAESKTYRPWDALLHVGVSPAQLWRQYGHLIGESKAVVIPDNAPFAKYFDLRHQLRAQPFELGRVLAGWRELFAEKTENSKEGGEQ